MKSSSPSYPINPEHREARQAEIDRKRAEIKEAMTPEERDRLEAIEKAVAILEAAQVSFLLWGSTDSKSPENMPAGWRGWWQFNKLSYLDLDTDFDKWKEESYYAGLSMTKYLLENHSMLFPGSIVTYDVNNKPLHLYKQGESHCLYQLDTPPPTS